jgi:hypothetical protein
VKNGISVHIARSSLIFLAGLMTTILYRFPKGFPRRKSSFEKPYHFYRC